MKARFIFFLLLIFRLGQLHAQSIVICGQIRDKDTKAKILGVNIRSSTGLSYPQDAKGFYSIKFNYPIDITLKFSHVGFNAESKTITKTQMQGKDTLRIDVYRC
jgi:hypothetical protein